MVVTTIRLRRLAAAWLLALPLVAAAQSDPQAPRLSDAWLATLQESQARVAWSHAFALDHATAEGLATQRRRLINELDALVVGARVVGNASLSGGLAAWRQTLADTPALPARTPGRHDLPWLGANPRRDPALGQIRHWGHCEVPGWVEVWHLDGVARLDWRSGMTLNRALAALPTGANRDAERAVIITPNGERVPRGIAAWNHQATPLSPGSRVVLTLPAGSGHSGALPPSVRQEIALINERLPAYLATRLPGEACELRAEPPAQDSTAGSPGSPGN
ncbi:capsule biosynthesis GfcC family protein [Halomonas sp.]|uniref:capsule biosynthesis GfcC family protein n=1 Tax=Halomonas sp. TaxID=1486246 RepID=UPI0025C0ABA1|nr:capsule biosynthesis GfcC family protein [Halomonas sp.]